MARTLAQIQKQIDTLKKEADSLRSKEVAGVVARIQEAIAHYGLTAQDLFGGKSAKAGKAAPQAKGKRQKRTADTAALPSAAPTKAARPSKPAGVIRFRDDAGHSWTGVGKRPRWYIEALASGKSADDLRVK